MARLNFDVHTNTLTRKIARSLGVITKLKQILPRKTLRNLYYTIIHSYLLLWCYYYGKYLQDPFEKTKISPKQRC